MTQKEQISKIKSLACKKHIKIYRLHKLELSNQEVAKALGTNAGHVYNALELYKKKPSFKKIAENIEAIIAEKAKAKTEKKEKKAAKKSAPKPSAKKVSKSKKSAKPTAKKMAEVVAGNAKTEAKVKTPKKAKAKKVKAIEEKEPSLTEMAAGFPNLETTELKEAEVVVAEESEGQEPDEE